jgi:Methyltransferase domain
VEAVFLDMDRVVAWLEENPSRWTLGPHCEIASDPGQWGHSLVNNAEILLPCLDAAGARSLIEVGAYAGDVTRLLLGWAGETGARVVAIDPSPQTSLAELAQQRSDLELVRETSHEALRHLPRADAVIIDGDHNYYTVSEELRLIEEQASVAGAPLPLLMFHDVRWPHARRDHYFAPELIPAERRQPTVNGGLFPGDPGIRDDGLPYTSVAAREGGPRNGVLTAVEDFVEARDGLQLAIVPTFFGLGIVWHQDVPYAGGLAEFLGPFDRNPVLERMEANRVMHLASMHSQAVQSMLQGQKIARQDAFLRRLRDSNAFAIAERISEIRQRGTPAFSREEVRRLLEE